LPTAWPAGLLILSRSIGYAAGWSVVELSDDEIEEAMRVYFTATHNVAEGAGAAALAAALQEQSLIRGKRISLD